MSIAVTGIGKADGPKIGCSTSTTGLTNTRLKFNRKVIDGPTSDEESEFKADGWNPKAILKEYERKATEALTYAQFLSHEPKWPRDRLRDLVSAREILFELDTIFWEGLAARGIDSLGKIFRESPDPCRVAFDSMPSFDVAVSLKTSYHRNANHPWKHNDIYDINALAGTVPYCDIVLTDKAAMSHVMKTGLPERLNTVMLARLAGLPEHL